MKRFRKLTLNYKGTNYCFLFIPERKFNSSPATYVASTNTIYLEMKFQWKQFSGKKIRMVSFYHELGHLVFEEIHREHSMIFEIGYFHFHAFLNEIVAWSLGLSIMCDLKNLDFHRVKEEYKDYVRACLLTYAYGLEIKAEFGLQQIQYLDISDLSRFVSCLQSIYRKYSKKFQGEYH